MPWTTTVDAKTGQAKSFFLDCSFGCRKAKLRATLATRTQPVYEVTWLNSRYSPERDSRKFDSREAGSAFYAKKKTARCKPEWIHHTSGQHVI